MLTDIKKALRINNNAMDTEVQDLIDAAKMDLKATGINIDKIIAVNEAEKMDPLIKRAITLYCKAHFGYNNTDATRFEQYYGALKIHLALSDDYRVVTPNV